MIKLPSIEKLAFALESEAPSIKISFYEEADPDNLYALIVGTNHASLRNKLAWVFGCEVEEKGSFSNCTYFEVYPDWHGRGQVNMRDLADEFIFLEGEFFDFSVTVAQLGAVAELSRDNFNATLRIPKFRSDWDTIHPGRVGTEGSLIDPVREQALLNEIAAHFAATCSSLTFHDEEPLRSVAPAAAVDERVEAIKERIKRYGLG